MQKRFVMTSACLLFILFQILFTLPLQAQTIAAGKILKINRLENDQYELTVREGANTSKYVVDRSTLIGVLVSAENVKQGQAILLDTGETDEAAPKLGLDLPAKPLAPKPVQIAKPPVELAEAIKQKAGIKSPVKEQVIEQPAAPEEMPSQGKKGKPKNPPPFFSDKELNKKQEGFFGQAEQNTSINAQGREVKIKSIQPKGSDVKKVLEFEKTEQGIRLELQDDQGQTEEAVLPPGKKILQKITVEELEKNMDVKVQRKPDAQDLAQKVIVMKAR